MVHLLWKAVATKEEEEEEEEALQQRLQHETWRAKKLGGSNRFFTLRWA